MVKAKQKELTDRNQITVISCKGAGLSAKNWFHSLQLLDYVNCSHVLYSLHTAEHTCCYNNLLP